MAEGAIPSEYKEPMALAIAFTTQCPYCIEIHSGKARAAGATDAEVAEAVTLAAALRAGAAITHVAHAFPESGEAKALFPREASARRAQPGVQVAGWKLWLGRAQPCQPARPTGEYLRAWPDVRRHGSAAGVARLSRAKVLRQMRYTSSDRNAWLTYAAPYRISR